MKILSSYKDYYDYLTGIWGEDPLLVLDRRDFKNISRERFDFSETAIRRVYIGNHCVQFLSKDREAYFGNSILEVLGKDAKKAEEIYTFQRPSIEKRYGMKWEDLVEHGIHQIKGSYSRHSCTEVLLKPFVCKRPPFLPPEVVIGMGDFETKNAYWDLKYPILKDIGVNKLVPPETVYQWITEYLSEQKNKQELTQDLRTDTQKLEGKGFDKRTSFRPNIKA